MTRAKETPKTTPKEITQPQLIQAVSDASKEVSCVKFGFILGAGASVTSNIPSGGWFANKWFEEIKHSIEEVALEGWMKSTEGFDKTNLAASYTKLFDKRFEVNYTLGYQELQRHMDKAKPSIGYSFLAQVLAQTANKFVITTNFDTMTEDALFDLKDAKPLVLGHELLSGFINANSPSRPTIVKVHRDFLFDPYNSDAQIETMDTQWQEALAPVLQNNAMIVIGYGGNDESLMGYLEAIKNRKPIYWCCRDTTGLSERINQLLNKNDFVIKIESFDKFMLLLSDKLGFKPLIDQENIHNCEIVKSAVARAEFYVTQLKSLAKEDLDEEEQSAIKKLLPSWWEYELAVKQEMDNDKKDQIYCEGLKAHPKSDDLMGNYAVFLTEVRKEYDKAEAFYLKALELEPEDADFNGNYAIFLSDIRKEYDKAEVFYLKALELEPEHANNNGNYASFLRYITKEYGKAEEFYLKALELEPKKAVFNGNYAQFLLVIGQKIKAVSYLETAFKYMTEESDLTLELWFYRLAHFPAFYEQAKENLDRLLADGHRSIGWSFDGNIQQAEKEGFQDIALLKQYAKKITEE